MLAAATWTAKHTLVHAPQQFQSAKHHHIPPTSAVVRDLTRCLLVLCACCCLLMLRHMQLVFRNYTLGWAMGCPMEFGIPVVVTLFLGLLLLPIPYWTRSSAAQPSDEQHSTSGPNSSSSGGNNRCGHVNPNSQLQANQQQHQVTRWLLRWRSRDWYWEVPYARLLVVVGFRTALFLLPPLSLGPLKPAPHLLHFHGYFQWSPFVQYVWRSWAAFTQLVGTRKPAHTHHTM